VLHSGREDEGRFDYYPDDVGDTWRSFPVGLANFAKEHEVLESDVNTLVGCSVPVGVLSKKPDSPVVLVNLDAFQDLTKIARPELSGSGKGLPAKLPAEDPVAAQGGAKKKPPVHVSVLIRDENKYYALSGRQLRNLETRDAGEARVLVRRGVVTAAVPINNLPIGTNCVLINLTELLPAPLKPAK
jgi:hypothetical protein